MIDREDCFAFRINGKTRKCVALSKTPCSECSFFKTQEEFMEDLEKYPPDFDKLRGEPLIPKEWSEEYER